MRVLILRLRAHRLDELVQFQRFHRVHGDGGGVLQTLVDVERHGQAHGRQTDVEAHPDESLDAARLQRVSLPPATVGRRAAVTTSSQADRHHDAADD